MRWGARVLLPATLFVAWQVAAENRVRVGAPEGRVPLRIAPDASADAAVHVPSGTEIDTLDDATNRWIRVIPPPQTPFWVYAELVRDGVVSVSKAQVRVGAGLTHKAITLLSLGTAVDVRGRLGDWVRIAAPTGVVLWVAGEYAATSALVPTPTPDATTGDMTGTNEPPVLRPETPLLPPPSCLQGQTLAAGRTQGERVHLRGGLDWSSHWRRDRPVSFDLLGLDPHDRQPVCQLVASAAAYETLLGCEVGVSGSIWWLADDPLPIVIADRIEVVAKDAPDAVSSP